MIFAEMALASWDLGYCVQLCVPIGWKIWVGGDSVAMKLVRWGRQKNVGEIMKKKASI